MKTALTLGLVERQAIKEAIVMIDEDALGLLIDAFPGRCRERQSNHFV